MVSIFIFVSFWLLHVFVCLLFSFDYHFLTFLVTLNDFFSAVTKLVPVSISTLVFVWLYFLQAFLRLPLMKEMLLRWNCLTNKFYHFFCVSFYHLVYGSLVSYCAFFFTAMLPYIFFLFPDLFWLFLFQFFLSALFFVSAFPHLSYSTILFERFFIFSIFSFT